LTPRDGRPKKMRGLPKDGPDEACSNPNSLLG
jgi:hypothetical protein